MSKDFFYRLFLEHPQLNGETYWQHILFTWKCSFQMLIAAICLFIHGAVPGIFTKTASDKVSDMHMTLEKRRQRMKQD